MKERVLILGEGGAGGQIVDYLAKKSKDVNVGVIVASDSESSKIRNIDEHSKIQLDIDGTGKKPDVGFHFASEKQAEIAKLLKDYDVIFHVNGLGGGTGTGVARYIAQVAAPERKHVFAGAMPSEYEGRDIHRNSLKNAMLLSEIGKVWVFDNRHNKSLVSYNDINKKIALEINYLLSLPGIMSYISRDMDTGNIYDIIFSHNGLGMLSGKRFEITNFEEPLNFENIIDRDVSVSYKFDLNSYEKVGVVFQLAKNQNLTPIAQDNIDKFMSFIHDKIPFGSFHPAVYKSDTEANSIFMFMSGPVLTSEQIEDVVKRFTDAQNSYVERFQKDVGYKLEIDLGADLEFNAKPKQQEKPVPREIAAAFEEDNSDFMNLLRPKKK